LLGHGLGGEVRLTETQTPAGAAAMEFRTARADIVWSVSQRWLLTCWTEARGKKAVPAWSGLSPEDLARQLDTLMFLDAVPQPAELRFRIRFLGRRIAESYGGDFNGRFLDEALPPAWRETALQTYRAALERRRPIYNVVDTRDRGGTLVRMERLLLPFTSNGGDPDRILASIETLSIAGKFEQNELGRSQYANGSCALVAVIDI
jgi:hypothetical protein